MPNIISLADVNCQLLFRKAILTYLSHQPNLQVVASNRQISNELFLGVRSIEKLRQDLKEKIGVRSKVGLLKYGLTKRLIVAELRQ